MGLGSRGVSPEKRVSAPPCDRTVLTTAVNLRSKNPAYRTTASRVYTATKQISVSKKQVAHSLDAQPLASSPREKDWSQGVLLLKVVVLL